jgi:hypothetical protein
VTGKRYQLVFRHPKDDCTSALKAMLKVAGRWYDFTCEDIRELPNVRKDGAGIAAAPAPGISQSSGVNRG